MSPTRLSLTTAIVAVSLFLLGLDRKTTLITESMGLPDGTIGLVELPSNVCRNRGISNFFQLSFKAKWTEATATRAHSTLFQLGATERDGVRIDLGRSLQNPETRSYFLVVGSRETTDGYVWEELNLPIDSQGSATIKISVYDQQVHILVEVANNLQLTFLGPAPNLNCRKLYFGEGPKGLVPQFSSEALYPSEIYSENIYLTFGERVKKNRFNVPILLDRIFDWVFIAAICTTLLAALKSQLSGLSKFLKFAVRYVTLVQTSLKRVIKSTYVSTPPRSDVVVQFSFFLLLYFIAFGAIYIRSALGGRDFPWNSFLPGPTNQGTDFFLLFSEWAIHGGLEGARNYGPTTYWALEFLSAVTPNPYTAILILRLTTTVVIGALSFLLLRSSGFVNSLLATILVMFSYPTTFMIHTGNLESFTLIGLLAAAMAARNGQWRLFSVIIGILGAIKILPLIFMIIVILIFRPRDVIRLWMLSAAVTIAATAFSLIALPGGLIDGGLSGLLRSIRAIQAAFDFYYEFMVVGAPGINFGHSFLNGIHAIWGLQKMPSDDWGNLVVAFFVATAFVGLALLRHVKAPLWYGVLLTGVVGCIAPPTSTDYKLIYLIPGIILFILEDSVRPQEVALTLLATTTLVPKPYLYVGLNPFNSATLWITTVTLLMLVFLIPIVGFGTYRGSERVMRVA